jgi:hypothetical protein
MRFAQAKFDSLRFFSYHCIMINSVHKLIPIAIDTAQGVRVVVRVTGILLRG